MTLATMLRYHALWVLVSEYGLSTTEAAELVGIPRSTAFRLIRRWLGQVA